MMVALKSQFTNSLCLLPVAELINAGIAKARALSAIPVSLSPSLANTWSRLSPINISIFVFFVTCSSSLVHRQKQHSFRVFSGTWRGWPCRILDFRVRNFPSGFLFFQNERTPNTSGYEMRKGI